MSSIVATSVAAVQLCARSRVLACREAAHGHPDRNAELAERRQHVGEKQVTAGVREADRVEHAVVGLGEPHGRVSLARQRRDRLRDEGVELPRRFRRGQPVEAAGGVEQHLRATLASGCDSSYVTVKLVALVAVPAPVVTKIFPVVAPAGTRARIRVDEITNTQVAFVRLNVTDCTPVKPVPLIVT